MGLLDSDASGDDLPPDVIILDAGFNSSQTDEGRAMAEIIHDLAPGATLLFHTGFPSAFAMVEAVEELSKEGADIIVDDLGFFREPVFEDGPVARAVQRAIEDAGVIYVTAVGNDANAHYKGVYQEFDPNDGDPSMNLHDFGGGDVTMSIVIAHDVRNLVMTQCTIPNRPIIFDQECRYGCHMGRCSRGAKERIKIGHGGHDPIRGNQVRLGARLKRRLSVTVKKDLARAMRTKGFNRIEARIGCTNRTHSQRIAHAWMPEDTTTGNAVLQNCCSPEKIDRQRQGGTRDAVDEQGDSDKVVTRIHDNDLFDGGGIAVQLTIVTDTVATQLRHITGRITTASIKQQKIIVRRIGRPIKAIGPLQESGERTRTLGTSWGDHNGHGNVTPAEEVILVNTSNNFVTVTLLINRVAGPALPLAINFLGTATILQHSVASGSVFGHPCVRDTLAVGAIRAADPGFDTIEPFSSHKGHEN